MKQRHSMKVLVALSPLLWVTVAGIPAFASEGPAVIKLWDHHVHDKKFRKDIFKAFNSQNPEIKVEYTSQVS